MYKINLLFNLLQDCVCGFEFSGRTINGRRVMGMSNSRCLSNTVIGDSYLLWDIPDNWTLEQAASVPVVYGTVSLKEQLYGTVFKFHE